MDRNQQQNTTLMPRRGSRTSPRMKSKRSPRKTTSRRYRAANNQDVEDVVASVRHLFGLLPVEQRNALCAELCTGGIVAVDSRPRVRHAIDPMDFIDDDDSYPSVGGWPNGVQCPACGRISSGSGGLSSKRKWIEPDANDPRRNPDAQCWSITS